MADARAKLRRHPVSYLLVHAAHLALPNLMPQLHLMLLGHQEAIALALLVALRKLCAQIKAQIAVEASSVTRRGRHGSKGMQRALTATHAASRTALDHSPDMVTHSVALLRDLVVLCSKRSFPVSKRILGTAHAT